ncbi:hypothetical protein SLS56_011203 [Neofusicoccum ribis]|uniref:NAD-dependent epimerase/dehydratase domain-containing protein n=1 Tax=Neofusicoccum ribis TaxID=45134 RepID=A0ABR3SCD3_9PEZI
MASISNPALPAKSLVLVTGVNGLVGSHVAEQLLLHGYRVRGTVRETAKNAWLRDLFGAKYGPEAFELVRVADMATEGAFDAAVQGVAGVVHVASVMGNSPDPNEVVTPSGAFVVNVLRAAAREPGVKRFVFTSSTFALPKPKPGEKATVTADAWDEEAEALAWAPPPYTPERGLAVYTASKVHAEKQLWKWAEENRPGFVVNAGKVLPGFVIGKSVSVEHQGHPSSAAVPVQFFEGDEQALNYFNSAAPGGGNLAPTLHFVPSQLTLLSAEFIDAEDTGRLHVAALIHPDVVNERVFADARTFQVNTVLATLRKLFPGRQFPQDVPQSPMYDLEFAGDNITGSTAITANGNNR